MISKTEDKPEITQQSNSNEGTNKVIQIHQPSRDEMLIYVKEKIAVKYFSKNKREFTIIQAIGLERLKFIKEKYESTYYPDSLPFQVVDFSLKQVLSSTMVKHKDKSEQEEVKEIGELFSELKVDSPDTKHKTYVLLMENIRAIIDASDNNRLIKIKENPDEFKKKIAKVAIVCHILGVWDVMVAGIHKKFNEDVYNYEHFEKKIGLNSFILSNGDVFILDVAIADFIRNKDYLNDKITTNLIKASIAIASGAIVDEKNSISTKELVDAKLFTMVPEDFVDKLLHLTTTYQRGLFLINEYYQSEKRRKLAREMSTEFNYVINSTSLTLKDNLAAAIAANNQRIPKSTNSFEGHRSLSSGSSNDTSSIKDKPILNIFGRVVTSGNNSDDEPHSSLNPARDIPTMSQNVFNKIGISSNSSDDSQYTPKFKKEELSIADITDLDDLEKSNDNSPKNLSYLEKIQKQSSPGGQNKNKDNLNDSFGNM